MGGTSTLSVSDLRKRNEEELRKERGLKTAVTALVSAIIGGLISTVLIYSALR